MLNISEVDVLLVLDTLPVVALPPVVLPLTTADPLAPDWLLTLLTVAVFVLTSVSVFVSLNVTELSEDGPVLLIEALFGEPPANIAAAAAAAPALLRLALVLLELELLTAPVDAPPPVVLPVTAAAPLAPACVLVFVTAATLVGRIVAVFASLNAIVFDELGPVVPIVPVCADANPVLRPTPNAVTAKARSNFFISYSFLG